MSPQVRLNFDKRWGETIFDGWSILRISLQTPRLLGFKFSVLIALSIIDCQIWTLFKIWKIRKFGFLRKIILYYFSHSWLTNRMEGLSGCMESKCDIDAWHGLASWKKDKTYIVAFIKMFTQMKNIQMTQIKFFGLCVV